METRRQISGECAVRGFVQPVAREGIAPAAQRAEGPEHGADCVHEAYLRLERSERLEITDREHFVKLVAKVMRGILVDRARARSIKPIPTVSASSGRRGHAQDHTAPVAQASFRRCRRRPWTA